MSRSSTRRRSRFKTAAFSGMAMVLGLALLEGLATLLEPAIGRFETRIPTYGPAPGSRFFIVDPTTGYALRPGAEGTYRSRTGQLRPYRINALGCNDRDLGGRPPRVIFLGDSCTFGEGLEGEEPAFHEILEASRTSHQRPFLNAGVPGYSSPKARTWLEHRLLDLEPEVVVIWIGWNDRWWAQDDPRRLALSSGSGVALAQILFDTLALGRILQKVLAPWIRRLHHHWHRQKSSAWRPINPPESFRENLSRMVEACRKAEVIPILMTNPSGARRLEDVPRWMIQTGALPDYQLFLDLHEEYNALIREVSGTHDVRLVDLDRILAETPAKEIFTRPAVDPVHPNARGHALIARSLDPVLAEAFAAGRGGSDPGGSPRTPPPADG